MSKEKSLKIFLMREKDFKKIEKKDIDVLILSKKILENFEEGRKILERLFLLKRKKNFLIGIEGKDYKKDKAYLDLKFYGIPAIDIFFPFLKEEKEPIHFSNSGLNHVLLGIMNKNNIGIGIDLIEVIKEMKKKNFFYVSRLMQNLRWARKKRVNLCLINFDCFDVIDVKHFLISIGFDTKQAKKAFDFVFLKKQLNKEIFEHKRGKMYFYKKDEKINLIEYLIALKN